MNSNQETIYQHPRVSWSSPKPTHCQICVKPLKWRDFIDGRLFDGPWAIMCLSCHKDFGTGFGLGKGQKYHWDPQTKAFWKVEG